MESLKALQEALPSYAKDIKLNLSNLLLDTHLTPQQFWGTMLACALTSKHKLLIHAVTNEARNHLSSEALTAANIAATLMAMNNIYYRFTHSISNKDYGQLPANLRMTLLAQPGVDKIDFELYALAVSAINGCGFCMDAHEKILTNKQVSKEGIQTAIRIAAVISATAMALN
jgi:alkyl hydroperoxide reductase subunit D